MIKKIWLPLMAALSLLTACAMPSSSAPAITQNGFTVRDPWARATSGVLVSAAYMTIENSGAADTLVSAATDVAEVVEIHETKMEGGMMQMAPLKNGLDIPANGKVELKPGGYHVMMPKLKRELKAGEKIALMLKFKSGKEVKLDLPVRTVSGDSMH